MTKPEIADRARATAAHQHRQRRWYRKLYHRIQCARGKHADVLRLHEKGMWVVWECKYCGRKA